MRRFWVLIAMLMVVLLGGITLWHCAARAPHPSALYLRCCDVPGIRAGYIEDCPLGDSLVVDVTTIEALTDEAWEWMEEAFALERMLEGWELLCDSVNLHFEHTENDINMWRSARDHPEVWGSRLADPAADTCDCIIASPYYRWMAVFRTKSIAESSAVVGYYMKDRIRKSMASPLPEGNDAAPTIKKR